MRKHNELYCQAAVRTISLLRGKRKIEILCILRSEPARLGQLVRLVPSASKKVLVENLRQLEGDGIITRRDLSGTVRHVEYRIVDSLGEPTRELLDELQNFGDRHLTLTEATTLERKL